MANQFLTLSLFIMLLSFFIILNTVSNFETLKSKPVLNSLALAFANREVEQDLQPETIEAPEQAANEGDTLTKLDRLFNAQIIGAEVSRNRLGTIMHVRMSVKEFEKAISRSGGQTDVVITPGTETSDGSFFPTLVSLVQSHNMGAPYRMDMVLNAKDAPAEMAKDNPEVLKSRIATIESFSKTLESFGLPKKFMSAGLRQGDPEMIDIYFKRYEPFNPLGNQSGQ